MAPGRFVAINVGTAISNDGMKPINADAAKMMENLNFIYKKEVIWVKPKGMQRLWQRGVTKFLKYEQYQCFSLNIMHEYILIFQNEGQMRIPIKTDTDCLKISLRKFHGVFGSAMLKSILHHFQMRYRRD